jgi:1-acyl-sn-glycerol-3-phosphate acyltransferase
MKEIPQRRVSRSLVFTQFLMGIGVTLAIALPFLRRVHGINRLRRDQKYLFVSNHVSLLDTILLGAVCWRSGHYPILVLGDKQVWHVSWFHKLLSKPIGFLVERGKINPDRIRELEAFGRSGNEFHLVVFPEGTRGDGVNVARCQPGLFHIAQEAKLPIVPIFIENMQLVSTKTGSFHPISGLRKVEVHFGEPIEAQNYLTLSREEFVEFVRENIAGTKPAPAAERSSPAPLRV